MTENHGSELSSILGAHGLAAVEALIYQAVGEVCRNDSKAG